LKQLFGSRSVDAQVGQDLRRAGDRQPPHLERRADLILGSLLFRCQLNPPPGEPHSFGLHLNLALSGQGLEEGVKKHVRRQPRVGRVSGAGSRAQVFLGQPRNQGVFGVELPELFNHSFRQFPEMVLVREQLRRLPQQQKPIRRGKHPADPQNLGRKPSGARHESSEGSFSGLSHQQFQPNFGIAFLQSVEKRTVAPPKRRLAGWLSSTDPPPMVMTGENWRMIK
jgi:hypothetical protein